MSAKLRLARLWRLLDSIPLDLLDTSATDTPMGAQGESSTPKREAIVFTCVHCATGRSPGEPRFSVVPPYRERVNFRAPNKPSPTTDDDYRDFEPEDFK